MDDESQAPLPPKPSMIPSWVMLGFLLGAAFVLAFPRKAPPPPPAAETPPPPLAAPAPRTVTTIEAVFDAWGKYAVWSDNTTEVALWDPSTNAFSDCYEVLKVGDGLYFRSISGLTRPLLEHGVADGSPLQFTETARQRADWLRQRSEENWKAMAEGVRDSMRATPTAAPGGQK